MIFDEVYNLPKPNGADGECRKMKHGFARRGKKIAEYLVWEQMKKRCNSEKSKDFKWYGGKGIKVCDRWSASFENFFKDMGPRPSPKHSIDRIDGARNYEPGNCRWTTQDNQTRNMTKQRRRFLIPYQGVSAKFRKGSWTGKYQVAAKDKLTGKNRYIGWYQSAIQAGMEYDKFVVTFDEHVRLNFPHLKEQYLMGSL